MQLNCGVASPSQTQITCAFRFLAMERGRPDRRQPVDARTGLAKATDDVVDTDKCPVDNVELERLQFEARRGDPDKEFAGGYIAAYGDQVCELKAVAFAALH
ncbi:hypothetical protein Snas_3596 [Stackebrandtia nassauensis DSM 44728]|uniref:Uncharacterized protein n=1 Tax=Stackebrandtia nassauensis (strain DSM 44728 / CIP 108903 / NRRL B-16338 / NBRC 102104 / LLR-40K-21) TaxID=446470 RepID=D3PWN4_STANL|nr:hypothetical protein Snas_3596 [Stackebrandtia nassauensis DSM 44728]